MTISDDLLMAYADGELDAASRAEIESAAAKDPALAEKINAHKTLRIKLSNAFDPVLTEKIPERLQRAARRSPAQKSPGANVIRFQPKRPSAQDSSAAPRRWGALAAGLAAGLMLGVGVTGLRQPLISASSNGLSAQGPLAAALDSQAAADSGAAVRIGLTFQNTAGEYCRTFDAPQNGVAGLACRRSGAWRVVMTVGGGEANGGGFRQAGSDTPQAILSTVDSMIAGEVFDAAQEKQAMRAEWRGTKK